MRFGYVLLGLVALTSIHMSSGQCTNGFAGVQKDDICCDLGCGTCGGSSCGQQPPGADSCCTSRIRDSGMVCSDTQSAPCIIDNDGQCSNGLLGIQKDDICCDPDCGMCGGSSCGQQTGGADSCCTSRIRNSGEMCSETQAAPCIIDDATACPALRKTAPVARLSAGHVEDAVAAVVPVERRAAAPVKSSTAMFTAATPEWHRALSTTRTSTTIVRGPTPFMPVSTTSVANGTGGGGDEYPSLAPNYVVWKVSPGMELSDVGDVTKPKGALRTELHPIKNHVGGGCFSIG